MFVSTEWTEYSGRMGIPDSSLPIDVEEILRLRSALTNLEDATLVRLKDLRSEETRGLTVTTLWIPARDGHKIRCLLYKPDGDGPFPVYVYMHGGGWVVGRPETDDISNRNLCRLRNVLIFSIDYRLAPEHPYPTPIQDCEDVLCWAQRNAHAFDGTIGSGLVLGGFSAGGQLASSLVAWARNQRIPVPIRGLILRSPWLSDWRALSPELKASLKSIEENANAPYVTSDRLRLMLQWYNVPKSERTNPSIFPLHIDHNMAIEFPPVFVQISGADPLRDEGATFHELMQKSGVPSKLLHYEGMPHGFHTHNIPTGVKAEADMQDGFEWILATDGKTKLSLDLKL